MITISHFPNDICCHLAGFVHTVRKTQRLSMELVWEYNRDDSLNVNIQIRSTGQQLLEQLLSAELSGKGFLYVQDNVAISPSASGLKHYLFLPQSTPSPLSAPGLSVLLASLLQSHGRLTVDVEADYRDVRMAMSADVLNPLPINHAFGHCFRVSAQEGGKAFFVADDTVLERLLQLPYCTAENGLLIAGFGNRQASASPTADDVTLGSIVGDILGRKMLVSAENLTSSTLILGISGYGKSTFLKNCLINSYRKKKIPFLVLEPAKNEYRDLKKLVPELLVLDDMGAFSPLMPPVGVSPFLWSDVFVDMVASAMNIPNDSSLQGHFREAYENCFSHKTNIVSEFIELTKHFSERQSDYRQNGAQTLTNFFRYFYAGSTEKKKKRFPVDEILNRPTVICLGNIPSPAMRFSYLYFIIKHIQAHIAQQQTSDHINHLLALEECHHILGRDVPPRLLTEVLNVIREARSKALSTIYADQSAGALSEQALSQAGNIVSFRQTSVDDQKKMADSLLCKPEDINLLPKYTAMVRMNQMVYPARVRIDASPLYDK